MNGAVHAVLCCACSTDTVTVDGVCHVCRRPKMTPISFAPAPDTVRSDGLVVGPLLSAIIAKQTRTIEAARRIRAALDAADLGGYRNAALFYVDRADVEKLLDGVQSQPLDIPSERV